MPVRDYMVRREVISNSRFREQLRWYMEEDGPGGGYTPQGSSPSPSNMDPAPAVMNQPPGTRLRFEDLQIPHRVIGRTPMAIQNPFSTMDLGAQAFGTTMRSPCPPQIPRAMAADSEGFKRVALKVADYRKFDPKDATYNIDDFIDDLESTGRIRPALEMCEFIPRLLEGNAREWYNNLSDAMKTRLGVTTWSGWKDLLRWQFLPAEYSIMLREQLHIQRFNPGKHTMDQYCQKVRKLCRCVY